MGCAASPMHSRRPSGCTHSSSDGLSTIGTHVMRDAWIASSFNLSPCQLQTPLARTQTSYLGSAFFSALTRSSLGTRNAPLAASRRGTYTSSVNTSSSPSSGTFCGIGLYTFRAAKGRTYNGVRHRAIVRPYPHEHLPLADRRQHTRQQRTLDGERTCDRSSAISFLSCGLVIALSGTIALPVPRTVSAVLYIDEDTRART